MENIDGPRVLRALVTQPEVQPIIPKPIAPTITQKEAQFFALAKELGYSVTPMAKWKKELATRIAASMRTRQGLLIYQSAAFDLPNFPLELAEQLFAFATKMADTPKGTSTWRAETMAATSALFGSIFVGQVNNCVGASKAIKKPSERFVRVLATIMPRFEISHVKLSRGVERLYVNFMYVLATEAGEVNPPKDNTRREISIDSTEMTVLRQQILTDACHLGQMGVPLSAAWWRQLGDESKAAVAQALQLNAAAQPAPPPGSKKRKASAEIFEVEDVVEESGRWVLVQWAGYHPSWEVWRISGEMGDPVRTWEPTSKMKKTEAMLRWRGC